MNFRKPTIPELFPHAMQTDLAAKRADQYVNNVFETVGRHVINKNLPTELFIEESNTPLVIDPTPGHVHISTYIKNHWKVIAFSIIVGGVLYYAYHQSNEKRRKKNMQYMSRTFKPLKIAENSE